MTAQPWVLSTHQALAIHAMIIRIGAGRAGLRLHDVMRVDDKFLRNAGVERLVGLGRLPERNQLDIDRLRNPDAIVKDRHHQPTVVFHHGCLTRRKGMGLCPSESQPHLSMSITMEFGCDPAHNGPQGGIAA